MIDDDVITRLVEFHDRIKAPAMVPGADAPRGKRMLRRRRTLIAGGAAAAGRNGAGDRRRHDRRAARRGPRPGAARPQPRSHADSDRSGHRRRRVAARADPRRGGGRG